ncbi:MAG TPA: urease accessory protein UreE [Arcobacter sp.]|nr:urease accessory protein UreE [Arcobacter sp.]
MIKKVIKIQKDIVNSDSVELSWFDMQKPNLTGLSKNGVEFIVKAKFTHLHENDVLLCEDGYAIKVLKSEDEVYELEFKTPLLFARIAYEIGNRHQPVCIEQYKITVLDDISLSDIIKICQDDDMINVNKIKGYFKPNGKAHHSH